MIADKVAKFEPGLLAAVRAEEPLADEKLQALSVFTSHLFQTRGLISNAEAAAFLAAGYSEQADTGNHSGDLSQNVKQLLEPHLPYEHRCGICRL